eukprot:5302858-Pleurochrysis_carterae.AAC.1
MQTCKAQPSQPGRAVIGIGKVRLRRNDRINSRGALVGVNVHAREHVRFCASTCVGMCARLRRRVRVRAQMCSSADVLERVRLGARRRAF